MKHINYTVILFAVVLTLGIVTGYYISFSFTQLVGGLIFCTVLLLGVFIKASKQLQPSLLFAIAAYLTLFSIGVINYQLRLPKFKKTHYQSFQYKTSETPILQLKISELLKPNNYYDTYLASLQGINEEKATGKVVLSIRKDSLLKPLKIDDVLLISQKIKPVKKALNPNQFDYSAYLKTIDVYGQILIDKEEIITVKKGTKTLKGIAETIRNHCIEKLKQSVIGTNERSILQALVLGQKRTIDKTIYNQYADAGAVHILAVSGLHVGILYLLFLFICKPLRIIPYGKTVQVITTIVMLWGFAILTGLSPSVTRAVTMFSLFGLATLLNRQTSTINTLAISYIILLLWNPNWLFSVGFQLSYLAVLSILLIQPKLSTYYQPRNFFLKRAWDITTVTIAAQVGLLPLSIYYFHQIPGLFLISNLVILPLLGIILSVGIVVIVLAALDFLPEWLATFYNFIIECLNSFVMWVASQDAFIVKGLSFSLYSLLAIYILLISIYILWKKYSNQKLIFSIACACLVCTTFIASSYSNSGTQLIIFHKTAQTLVGVKNASEMLVLKRDTSMVKNNYPISPFRIKNNISQYSEAHLPNYFKYNDKAILVIDSLSVYPKKDSIDYVLLIESPKLNFDRMLDSLTPKQIIADGSNYKSYINRWIESCKRKKTPFHYTGAKGAFKID